MSGPKFTARADGDLVRLVIVVTGETFQSLSPTQAEARSLRDALTLALAPPGAGEPRLPCRITKGRKACRSCGAVSGQAHAEGCAEVLQPPEEGERRVGPPERRAAWAASRHPATELTYRGTVWGTMQSGPPSVDNLPRAVRDEASGTAWIGDRLVEDPPTPEEKAAGERTKYLETLPCAECHGREGAHARECSKHPSRPTLGERITYPPIEPLPAPRLVACDECFMCPPSHLSGCSKR